MGGQDQQSEQEQHIRAKEKRCFKMKYVTRMEDVVIGNHWRLWQTHSIIILYLNEQKRKK